MELPEHNNKTGQSGGRTSVIMFFLLVIVVICLSLFAYMRNKGINIVDISLKNIFSAGYGEKAKSGDDVKPTVIEYDIKEHPDFCTYGNVLIKSTRDYVKGLDRDGKEVWSVPIAASSPLVKTNGSELLVTGIGSKEVYIIKGKDVSWTAKLDENVLNAHISEDGYVTVVNEAKGYRGQVRVFDPAGVEMFKRFVAQNFVLSAGVSPSGGQFMINFIDASGIKVGSYLDFFDMKELMSGRKEPVAGIRLDEEDIFPFLWQLKDDSFFGVGCSTVVYVDKEKNEKWSKKYEKIYSSSLIRSKYLVVAAIEEGSNNFSGSKLGILNSEGHETASYTIMDEVRNIQVYDDMIAVNTGREVHIVNAKGKPVSKFSFKSDVLDVYFFNRVEAAVITRNSVEFIKI